LARHLAESRFGVTLERPAVNAGDVVSLLLDEVTRGPEVWHQRSYLARVVKVGGDGMVDAGIEPLAHFVDDDSGPDAAAITLESNGRDDPYPAVYVRSKGSVKEYLLPPQPPTPSAASRRTNGRRAAPSACASVCTRARRRWSATSTSASTCITRRESRHRRTAARW